MTEISALDGAVLAILGIAIARGLFIGLLREGFSLAALGAACLAVRYGGGPVGHWLVELSRGEVGAGAASWIAGAALAVVAVVAVTLIGRVLRRGVRAAGLGWADRLGGGALGAAEGALVATVVLISATWVLGRDHPALADSRSLVAFDDVRELVGGRSPGLPDVATPPWRR